MTNHRFFISKEQIRNESVFLTDNQARQIHNVLRLRQGDKIYVLNNEGWEFEVELLTTKPDQVTGRLVNRWIVKSEPKSRLTLFQSMLKQVKFEWILQKGTELGITSFVPMITERSIVRQSTLKQNKMARWQRIICEAAEQSGRGRIPTLSQPVEFVAALEAAQTNHLAMIPWENELERTIADTLAFNSHHEQDHIHNIALLIGPEGGFTESEIQIAQSVNITPVTLGPRILRAETAAIVATALTFHELGELN
jgi:16S rRNA (uracil1498-N3)-methyltransferase